MERKQIKCVFFDFDKYGNGYIEKKEFFLVLKKMGLMEVNEIESEEIFNNIDRDGNGMIIFVEFYEYFIKNIISDEKFVLCKVFVEVDENERGVVNFKEFLEFVRNRNIIVIFEKLLFIFDKLCGENEKEEFIY